MLKIENLCKTYARGHVKAVDDLTLHVRKGEIFGFLGPNGAGKTTTLKMICGMIGADSGSISVDGYRMDQEPLKLKRSIGFVPDEQNVFDRLTGYEYLNFLSDIYGVSIPERKARMEKYLNMFELSHAASDPLKSYSHGMRQKIAIAGALIHHPPLWILDEPLTGLDPRSAHLLKQEMREHCQAGNAVFFSTHVLEVAEKLCDRIGIIHHGKLVALGTLEQLRSGETGESLEQLFLELTETEGD